MIAAGIQINGLSRFALSEDLRPLGAVPHSSNQWCELLQRVTLFTLPFQALSLLGLALHLVD